VSSPFNLTDVASIEFGDHTGQYGAGDGDHSVKIDDAVPRHSICRAERYFLRVLSDGRSDLRDRYLRSMPSARIPAEEEDGVALTGRPGGPPNLTPLHGLCAAPSRAIELPH
jgi:hypothetical protein